MEDENVVESNIDPVNTFPSHTDNEDLDNIKPIKSINVTKNVKNGPAAKRRRIDNRSIAWTNITSKEELLKTTITKVPSRFQPNVDAKKCLHHDVTGAELSRRINGCEKMRSTSTLCKLLMIGTSNANNRGNPSRTDLKHIYDLLKEDKDCSHTALYSAFSLLTEGDVKKLGSDIEVVSEEVIPYNRVKAKVMPLLGDTPSEQEEAVRITRKTINTVISSLNDTKFDEATHGGMRILKAAWHIFKSVIDSGYDTLITNYTVNVIKKGYSYTDQGESFADGTITLVKGEKVIIVDTGLPADRDYILKGLRKYGLTSDQVDYVVCTHGHSDHIGNISLFPDSILIVGNDISKGDQYIDNQLDKGVPYVIDDQVEVIPTPGHMCHDVTVIVKTKDDVIAITGDLFECEEDLIKPHIWRSNSQNPDLQKKNREIVLRRADFIIPGHGVGFSVPKSAKSTF